MIDAALRDEIHKRLTLNWLIQGAAQHAGITLHHLVRGELNAIHPRLVPLYDQYALVNLLQFWHMEGILIMGAPGRFWRRAQTSPKHPFYGHALLSRYGGMLADSAKQRALQRSKEKRLTRWPIAFALQTTGLLARIHLYEWRREAALAEVAKKAAASAWGISTDRLDAELSRRVKETSAFGPLPKPRGVRAAFLRAAVCGYGGVVRRDDGSLAVVARGTNWLILTKELVKATAELICLHGLNQLDEETYRRVVHAADGLEKEPWMLQTGGELWRRVLAVMPNDRPIAEILMHMARLPAKSLESLMIAVMEQPTWARELLAQLGSVER